MTYHWDFFLQQFIAKNWWKRFQIGFIEKKKKKPVAQMLKEEEECNLKFLLSKLAYNKYAPPYTWRHYFDTLHIFL